VTAAVVKATESKLERQQRSKSFWQIQWNHCIKIIAKSGSS